MITKRKKRVLLGAAILVLILLSLELFCRFYLGLGDPPLSRSDPEIEYMFVGPRVYHRFGNVIEYNEFSQRTHAIDGRRKDPSEIRILMCGDSVINGGSQTDQSELATMLIEGRLKEEFKRPAVVMNVSAGSWGPPNYDAYVKRFGLFEANALVVVVSSHDFADSPTFEPLVGVDPDFPTKTPTFALEEAVERYLPRYLPHFAAAPASILPNLTQGQIDQSIAAFRDVIAMAQHKNIPVIVAQHLEQTEYGKPETEGHATLRKAAEEMGVNIVQLGDTFGPELKAGHAIYRDNIHPNAAGQKLMADAIYPAVDAAIKAEPAKAAMAPRDGRDAPMTLGAP